MINIDKPIAFIDLETTGLKILVDKIVEFSIVKVNPDGSKEHLSHRVNPAMPIPAEATEIHGITDADVAGQPKFSEYAEAIIKFMEGCDIAGFNNIRYDLPLLRREFKDIKIDFNMEGRNVVDCMMIYHMRERRNLAAAYLKYCGKELTKAHTAEGDAATVIEILEGQLAMYSDLPQDMKALHELCHPVHKNAIDSEGKFIKVNGKVICNFGEKHNGRDIWYIKKVDIGYFYFILRSDFSEEVKKIAKWALFAKRKAVKKPDGQSVMAVENNKKEGD